MIICSLSVIQHGFCVNVILVKCHSGKMTEYDKRNRNISSLDVKILLYNKYQDYQAFRRKYPGISFGGFVSGKHY